MRNFINYLLISLALSGLSQNDPDKPNVLFIAVDDMADWTGYLNGHPDVVTPNIDRLSNRGIAFTNTQCTSPVCGPSRAAIMTGLRPETSGAYHNLGDYRDFVPDAVSLPEYFRKNGYYTAGAGKLIHPYNNVVPEAFDLFGPGVGIVGTPFTDEELLTKNMPRTVSFGEGREPAALPLNGGLSGIDRPTNRWNTFDWGPLDITDDEMPDGEIANWGVEQLQKEYDKPFFLGVGFYKPHQPLYVPKKYFEMYDIDDISLPSTVVGDMHDIPEAGKQFAYAAWSAGLHSTVVKHNQWKEGVLSYLATITFVDAMVGKVINALDKSKHADNTAIVFWSDHGWNLGEKDHWGKFVPWLESTKVPFIVVPPRNAEQYAEGNQKVNTPVNLLDIYPTLVSMCSLPKKNELEGNDLSPILRDVDRSWDYPSICTVGRGTQSIVYEHWHYIHYYDGTEELYDLSRDPHGWVNLASFSEYAEKKDLLHSMIIEDERISQYVRYRDWKAVIKTSGEMMLFDFSTGFEISEQRNVALHNPMIVRKIQSYLDEVGPDNKYVNMEE